MKYFRAVLVGALLWAIIFALWSIMVFVPVLKDMVQAQWIIYYLLLVPIVMFGANYFYKAKHTKKLNGFCVGAIMLATVVALDALISVPLFMIPQGMTHVDFFLQTNMIFAMVEFVLIAGLYWKKKIA